MTDVSLGAAVEECVRRLTRDDVVGRIWERDVTVWGGRPDTPELGDRLGWLDLPDTMAPHVKDLDGFARDVRRDFDRIVLCGMGGSSLAPEVLARTVGSRSGFPSLHLLDSTHPEAVRAAVPRDALSLTLFLIASKSGTTIETASAERYWWEATGGNGAQFAAITDPGTELARRAVTMGYRRVFLNPPDIGGRFSALSLFGLVPAALIGVDIGGLLGRAREGAAECRRPPAENPGALLGALLAGGTGGGRDKLTLLLDERLDTFGVWVEQLVAESTGKEGRGVLPVVGETPDDLSGTERDRVFVLRGLEDDSATALSRAAERLGRAAPPVDARWLRGPLELGAEFFRWEFATAIAGAVLGVNPFDQPNVAESKVNTARVLATGTASPAGESAEAVRRLLAGVRTADYVAVMAYLPPTPATDARLARLRRALARRAGVAVTVGYGPRFLHSTGQYHKGGPARGHFLQIVDVGGPDLAIPGVAYGFRRLIDAQADGDLQALRGRGRPVVRVADLDALEREVRGE